MRSFFLISALIACCCAPLLAASSADTRQPTDPKAVVSNSNPDAGSVPVDDLFYTRSVMSPSWSPDLAGWSLLLAGFFFGLFIIRLVLERWLHHKFKNHL